MVNWKSLFNRGVICGTLLIVTACGEVTTNTATPAPSDTNPRGGATPPLQTDLNHPKGNMAVVLGANFSDPIGTLGTISLNSPRTPTRNIQPTHSDAVVRSFANKLYVVNRLGADNIQVVDPGQGFAVTKQFSVGQGTNPQDIIVTQPTKGYVTLYQPEDNRSGGLTVDDLLVVNPQSGEILKTIDLTPYTTDDGERFTRASSMVIVGDRIFVAVQDLPRNLALPPDQPGKIAVVDTKTDAVIGSLILSGRNPVDMDYSPTTGMIYVANSYFFDFKTPYGGVEVIDPKTMKSGGIVIDDFLLGGAPGDIEVGGSNGYVTVGSLDASKGSFVTKFDLNPAGTQSLTEVYRSGSYIQDCAIDQNGVLIVGDRDPKVAGILFIDTKTNKVIDGPINTGPVPSSITFIEGGASPAQGATAKSVSAITLQPSFTTIRGVGKELQLIVVVVFENSETKENAPEAVPDAWSSNNPNVATVDEKGKVRTVGVGEALITAKIGPRSAVTRIAVEAEPPKDSASSASPSSPSPSPPKEPIPCKKADSYADAVVSYKKGVKGGFNEDKLPGIVLGPPKGAGLTGGSFDVVSLGVGGEITLGFNRCSIVDGKGIDFTVFENPLEGFAEPGLVSVSENGVDFVEFKCDSEKPPFKGCAGVQSVLANPDLNTIDPTDPTVSGGDSFDLADVGLKTARFVRIRDSGIPLWPSLFYVSPTSGFDLDAIAIVNGVAP